VSILSGGFCVSLRRRLFAISALALFALLLSGPGPDAQAQESSASASYEKALRHFQNRDLENAVIELKAVLTADPNLLAAHVLVARVYLLIAEPAAAQDAIARSRRLGADPYITWPIRAEALFGQSKFDELLALSPDLSLSVIPQATVHLFRGRSYMEKGNYPQAELEFNKARNLTPAAPKPHVYLATVALRSGDVLTAEARAITGTRVAPESADVWSVQGDVLHMQGKLRAAADAYGNALSRDEEHYDARLSRAGVLLDLGDVEQAAVDVKRLRERRPFDPRPVYLQSVLLAKAKKLTEAREALQRAAALLDEMGTAALDRSMQLVLLAGLANFELGEFEQAQGHLARYVERYPLQPGPRKLLGSALLRNGRATEAINVMEPALAKAPNDYKLLSLLGAAYMRNDRHDIATGYLQKALKLSYGAPDVRARLALSRVGAGFEEQGLTELSSLFDENPQAYRRVGLTLASLELKRRGFARAAEVARTMLVSDEANLTVRNILGAAQMGLREFDAARTTFELAIASDESFLPARVNLAKLEFAVGNLELARDQLMRANEMRPDSVTTMVELAKVEQALGRSADGLRWLQKAQGTAPNSVPVALALVDLQMSAGDVAEATRIAREVESLAPENMDVLAAVARTHQAVGRDDLALGMFKQMARVAGFDTSVLYRVARLQIGAGAQGDAMYSLDKALKGDAAHLPSRLLLTELQVQNGRLEDATKAAQTLLKEHPDLAASHRLTGDVLLTTGDPQAAVVRYRQALDLEPKSLHALRVFGATMAAGEQSQAREFLETWVTTHPEDWVSTRALAESHLAAGRLTDARAFYERIIAKNPRDAGALNNLAFILDREKDPGAMDYAMRAVDAAPNDPLVLDTLGWMLVRQGKIEEGLRRLRDAHSRAASNPEIRYHIASALVSLARPDEARRELQIALQSPVPFDGMDDARKLLTKLAP
jgi:putative PEP-CTERM system TPR-repeat lipoprotein